MRTRIAAALGLILLTAGGAVAQQGPARTETAVFASGCFWCTEADLEKVPGVISAVSGYTGGRDPDPTYEEVSAGDTGHYEAVQVTYDPARVSYEALLQAFWRTVDPHDATGQFCDKGEMYLGAVFVATDAQRQAAEASKAKVASQLKEPVVTAILPAATFFPAEEYHQDYAKKNPLKYRFYRTSCGRDARLQQVWGALTN
ncbi:MAG TPA: peptide-methionine (S)-S-oxide reductase MsrA [Microvirga sp.]|jgi:peptide-methionine (S)-S-oxide reductase|nr:peptide-methionine (S)-S-oxide reductase MsrA [Microvirga sp.]